MSSSEQAPEPTMDEILASIRKIISDDEPDGATKQDATSSEKVEPDAISPAADTAKDAGIADDLASAISTAQEPKQTSEEILDLTQVVEQQLSVEAETVSAPQADLPSGPPMGDALQDALKGIGDGTMSSSDAASSSSESADEQNLSAILADSGGQDAPATPDASMEAPSVAEPGAIFGQTKDASTTPEAASAFETSMPESSFGTITEPSHSAAGTPERSIDPLPSIELPDMPLADVAADGEAAETMADIPAADMRTDTAGDASMAEGLPQADELAMQMPDFQPEPPVSEPEVPAEPAPPETDVSGAGVVAAAAAMGAQTEITASDDEETPDVSASEAQGGKSLEDSVKDMLRPLLREWLDDNMERIVQDTVKDEVASGKFKPDSH